MIRFPRAWIAAISVGALWTAGYVDAAAAQAVEVFAEVGELFASDGEGNDAFGRSVSFDGERLAVGAPGQDAPGFTAGAVYIFERDPEGAWFETVKLPGEWSDELGSSVWLDGDRLAIGAAGDDALGTSAGAAFIFELQQGVWTEVAKLTASDGGLYELLGHDLQLAGDSLVVGAAGHDDDRGAVYVFERQGDGTWLETGKLAAGDGTAGDYFGTSLSLDGDHLMIGARNHDGHGAVYFFERQPSGLWLEAAELTSTDAAGDDRFGIAVSLDGDRLAVGAYRADGEVEDSGAVYIFESQPDGAWLQVARLNPPDPGMGDDFGRSVSLVGDRLAVGAPDDDDNGAQAGTVFLFERDANGSWSRIVKLRARDGTPSDSFGASVSLVGDRLAIGADGQDTKWQTETGSAYVFEIVEVSPTLSITGSCPGEITLATTGITPRERVELYDAMSTGTHVLDTGPCAGSELGLERPLLVKREIADFDQDGLLVRTVGERWCGTYAQVLDERTCLASEVVRIPGGGISAPSLAGQPMARSASDERRTGMR